MLPGMRWVAVAVIGLVLAPAAKAGQHERGVLAHGTRIAVPKRFRRLGENLALVGGRAPRPGRAVHLWLRSPGHRGVLLDRRMRRIGVGRASGLFGGRPATVWVLRVGRR